MEIMRKYELQNNAADLNLTHSEKIQHLSLFFNTTLTGTSKPEIQIACTVMQ